MRNPDEFDAFYRAAQHRLLLQTYALTGDLPAARGAVRDAFVAAWHHWRKVSRLEDPEAWVRPLAWRHAQRRHTARIWHRDRALEPEHRATLDALAKLTTSQRRTLLLTQLSRISMSEMAREAGLTDEEAQQRLQLATSQFALKRDVPSTSVRQHLQNLATRTNAVPFPRPSIIRRAGAARRRAHTGVGVAGTVAALLIAGAFAGQTDGAGSGLRDLRASGSADSPSAPPAVRLRIDDLLTTPQLAPLAPKRTFTATRTDDNTGGSGTYAICQQDPFADPAGVGALVRRFASDGKPKIAAIQAVERSTDIDAARAAYRTAVGWYAGCDVERVQLLSTHEITGAGDEGMLLVLRDWRAPVTTYSIGIARTGSLVTSVIREQADGAAPQLRPVLDIVGAAIRNLCDAEDAGACVGELRTRDVPPPATGTDRGMLQVVDLPPVSGLDQPWIATDPEKPDPRLNPAATTCDDATFIGKAITSARVRTFLLDRAPLPKRFGLSQVVGTFRTDAQATAFLATLYERLDTCEDRELSATLDRTFTRSSPGHELTTWRLTTEIAEGETVDYHLALIRIGRTVSEIAFVPAEGAQLATGAFQALAARAQARLENLQKK
jgi:DNA-directed RNA polymerase specialized sigma24 family protein